MLKGNTDRIVPLWCFGIMMVLSFIACNSPKEHTAPAIYARDSVAMMTSYGVNTLISDSGIMKYRIVRYGALGGEREREPQALDIPSWVVP